MERRAVTKGPKSLTKLPDSRSERQNEACEYCHSPLPENSRPEKKHCNDHCRRMAFDQKARTGTVRRVSRLSNGMMSVVYHIPETRRKPGDKIQESD